MRQLKEFEGEAEYLLAAAHRSKKTHIDREMHLSYTLWPTPQPPGLRHCSNITESFSAPQCSGAEEHSGDQRLHCLYCPLPESALKPVAAQEPKM